MSVNFGNLGATVYFNRRWWKLVTPGPGESVSLHGSMMLWRDDVAAFKADDGRSFTFGPTIVGCL
jgi:hypothetical protein